MVWLRAVADARGHDRKAQRVGFAWWLLHATRGQPKLSASEAKLSRLTGLSRHTVRNQLAQLVHWGLLEPDGTRAASATGGRRVTVYRLRMPAPNVQF